MRSGKGVGAKCQAGLLAVVVALAMASLPGTPAAASGGDHTVTGFGCQRGRRGADPRLRGGRGIQLGSHDPGIRNRSSRATGVPSIIGRCGFRPGVDDLVSRGRCRYGTRMAHFPRGSRLAGAAAFAAVVAFAGCGRGGGAEASFDAGRVEIARPGSTRPLNERAFVVYDGLGAENEPSVETTLGVTVLEIKQGDASDIDEFPENSTPHYVQFELENHGDGAIDVGAGPRGRITVRGSDGTIYETVGLVTISGEFDLCDRADSQATLAEGEAILDCAIVAVSDDVSPDVVLFEGDYADEKDPVGWTIADEG